MIKKSLTIIAIFLLSGHLYSQVIQEFLIEKPESKTQLKERRLKGKVKTIKTCFFKIESTTKQQNIKRLLNPNIYGLYETFNTSGRLTKKVNLNPPVYFPMDTIGGDSLVYNNKGKLEKNFYTNAAGKNFIKTFNDNEDIISQKEIKEDDDDKNSSLTNYYSYKYNAAGKKTEAIKYSYYGSQKNKKIIDTRSIYQYDDKGRLIEELRYGELLDFMVQKVEVPIKFSYIYDLNDNIIEESCFYKTLAYKANYNYDTKNVLIKQVLIEKAKIDTAILKDGVISQRTITNRNNYLENRIYKYEYDSKGNWIKLNILATVSENEKKQTRQETLITKEITYYE